MSFGLLFWVLMLLWLVFGAFTAWPRGGQPINKPLAGEKLLLFVLLILLGWKIFGAPVHP